MRPRKAFTHFCYFGFLSLTCNPFCAGGTYTGYPKIIMPTQGTFSNPMPEYFEASAYAGLRHITVSVGGAMDTTGESGKAKHIAEHAVVLMMELQAYAMVSHTPPRFDVVWKPLAQLEDATVKLTNATSCSPCVDWLITPFGEEHTIQVVKKVVGNRFNSFTFVWSTSNDAVYDAHCIGKACFGTMPTWQRYLNGPIDTTSETCRASYACETTFSAAIVTDGTTQTKKISDPATEYLQNFNISLMSIAVQGQNSVASVVADLQKKAPDLVIIGASGTEIGSVVEGIASTKYRPSAIVAVNTLSSAAEGGNLMNVVRDSQFQTLTFKQCVAFPLYYDPNGPDVESNLFLASNAAQIASRMKGNVTKFTAHLFSVMALAYQGIVHPRPGKNKLDSSRTEVSLQCQPWPWPGTASVPAGLGYPFDKPCRGLTYSFALDYSTGKPEREMLMSQTTLAGERVSGRKPLGHYTTQSTQVYNAFRPLIQGTPYRIRFLVYDSKPTETMLISNPVCPAWNIMKTTTTTTTTTATFSGFRVVHTWHIFAGLCLSIAWELVFS